MKNHNIDTSTNLTCYHCGEKCPTGNMHIGEKFFCCEGCKTVYEILQANSLCNYYNIQQHPGFSQKDNVRSMRFEFLDDSNLSSSLLTFESESLNIVRFYVPKIHCSSCIWLLENLQRIHNGIISSQVDFINKEVTVHYNPQQLGLRDVALLMSNIGYEPEFNMQQTGGAKYVTYNRKLLYKIGVAGFCFGNVMLLSFPEYLSSESGMNEKEFVKLFGILNITLSLPVLFYSAADYFVNSYKSLKQKYFTIDIPIAIGLAAIAIRSLYDIITASGPGYFDSLTGLVFFMMIGKYLQDATYHTLSFDRTYKSYFPFSVRIKKSGRTELKKVSDIQIGDRLVIHANEIIPCDAYLISPTAHIDYSFVTGESEPIAVACGDLIYAGGRLKGKSAEVETNKPVSQSYLTQLWNNEAFTKTQDEQGYSKIANNISKYFTAAILSIATLSLIYWYASGEIRTATHAFTSVLIIACPCALAITVPFVWGNIMRLLSADGFYAKHSKVLETLSVCDTIVLDKTGTLTINQPRIQSFVGKPLSNEEIILISTATKQSIHPLSRAIYNEFADAAIGEVQAFEEIAGKGIQASINQKEILLGSASFIFNTDSGNETNGQTQVHLNIDGDYKGYFILEQHLRPAIPFLLPALKHKYHIYILSGDKLNTAAAFENFIHPDHIYLNQTPESKLNFIKDLQAKHHKVIMVGDGLNDAGSLKQADVGIAMTDDLLQFTPGSDIIMNAATLSRFNKILEYVRFGRKLIYGIFTYSLLYNIIGMFFAVQGQLSPLIAAILMPISSLSVIGISYVGSWMKAYWSVRS